MDIDSWILSCIVLPGRGERRNGFLALYFMQRSVQEIEFGRPDSLHDADTPNEIRYLLSFLPNYQRYMEV